MKKFSYLFAVAASAACLLSCTDMNEDVIMKSDFVHPRGFISTGCS